MNTEDFHIFKQAAAWQNITKTAQHLNRTQSNVTARIQHLEHHFQTQLFYRHKQGVTLTPSGKILLPYAERVLHHIQDAETALSDAYQPKGMLAIGSMETTAATRLPELLSSFHSDYPEIELSLKTGSTKQLTEAVLHREIEGAFIGGEWGRPKLDGIEVFREDLIVVGKELNTETLEHPHVIVFQSGCFYRETFEKWLREEGIVPTGMMELNTLDGILGCVKAGLGITLLTKSAVRRAEGLDDLQQMELPFPYSPVPTYFIYHNEAVVTPAFRSFLEYL
ncbi:LysR family transcriptional regulator [Salibacterium halotolerans]|uniref:DNA-binding transcriptional regulator, LysR family n=1 Tax=Salibacterium halotolerans TaxID=1884432 RepID=A0A1I5WT21_9BACI|nr:LysR family transcriptional regulator [Salibacterium halotolerans]SFQ22596.1 DNA-binding transcriptional regulator, LysR family [Salibacterium halotolerans]